jgi:2'-5' RNA ligase
MRLFTAILFNKEIMDSLYDSVERLRSSAKSGTFTTKENLHLTVNFIGETKRLMEVQQAMKLAVEKTKVGSFALSIGGFGKFKRKEGDIYWIGVEKEPSLWRLQKELVKELKEIGFFDVDDKDYKPHLTLGRRVIVHEEFNESKFELGITSMQMEVARLSLMKSERIQGKLVYTEIYHIGLDNSIDK